MLSKERKQELIVKFSKSENDTGSVEIQIATLSERIKQISRHLETFQKDTHSRIGLLRLIGKRRRLSRYLERNSKESFKSVMSKLRE